MAVTGNREPLLSWRRICYLLIGIVVVIILFSAVPRKSEPQLHLPAHLESFGNVTAYNEVIDGLTDAQCSDMFPGLYSEIDRAVAYWRQRNHVISASDVEIEPTNAAMRIIIDDNQLRILESRHSVDPLGAAPDRAIGVLHLIQRALDSAISAGEKLPTVEIALNFQDDISPPSTKEDTHSYWAFAKTLSEDHHQRLWLMPNFDFWYYGSTGSFADAKREAMQHDRSFRDKIPKIVWRGNPNFNELRALLIETTRGKQWADVAGVTYNEDPPVAMPVDQFCKYAMTVYTEGVTYSGRLKFLMNCESLLFSHETEYATHYSHLMEKDGPNQNFVQVKRDWSDLESHVQMYLEHPQEATRVIKNNLATFRSRYTTRAATSCYIRRLIQGYGSVSYMPEVYVPKEGGEVLERRGVSFEEFFNSPKDIDYEHSAQR